MGWKPGHYLLLAVGLYALAATLALTFRGRQVAALRQEVAVYRAKAQWVPEGYLLPLPGACLPSRPENLPGAPRPYRKGVSAGFVFQNGDACVPVVRGMGVVAAFFGEVVKVDRDYKEPGPEDFRALLERVKEGLPPRRWTGFGASRSTSAIPTAAPASTPTSRPPTPGLGWEAGFTAETPSATWGTPASRAGRPGSSLRSGRGSPTGAPSSSRALPARSSCARPRPSSA